MSGLERRHLAQAIANGHEKCRHFDGIRNKVCRAGVSYADVRDASESPASWPCLHLPGNRRATTVCASREPMTAEELHAQQDKLLAAFDAAMAGNCPQCGAAMQKQEGKGTAVWSCPTHGFVRRD